MFIVTVVCMMNQYAANLDTWSFVQRNLTLLFFFSFEHWWARSMKPDLVIIFLSNTGGLVQRNLTLLFFFFRIGMPLSCDMVFTRSHVCVAVLFDALNKATQFTIYWLLMFDLEEWCFAKVQSSK
jgi:hypothetical protein